MLLTALLLFCLCFAGTHALCGCTGIEVPSTDQVHCWEVLPRAASTWVDADETCQAVGGHLGHPDGNNSKEIIEYVQKNYTKPVLTNVIAGSARAAIYAVICPNNSFYGLLPNSTAFSKKATNTTTCAFITKDSDELAFGPCGLDANVLCDRPLEKEDYCKAVPKCPTTVHSTTVTSTTSSTTNPTTTTSTPKKTSTAMENTTTTTTTRTTTARTTATTTATAETTTTAITTSKTTATTTKAVTSTSTKPTTVTKSSTTTTATTSSTKTSRNNPQTNIAAKSSGNKSTTKSPIVHAPTSSVSVNGSTTATTAQLNSTSGTPTTEASASTGCGRDQWDIFGWCTAWPLLLILLLLLLLLFLLCWILHCCCKLCIAPCQVRKNEEEEEEIKKDPPIPAPKKTFMPNLDILDTKVHKLNPYEDEKSATILPPPATVSQPVFVPIPTKEPKEPEKEIVVEEKIVYLDPPRPETHDIGVNTEPFSPLLRKGNAMKGDGDELDNDNKEMKSDDGLDNDKVEVQVRRPRVLHSPLPEVDGDLLDNISLPAEERSPEERRPPVIHSPLPDVDGDLGDDVSLPIERSHSAETVLPKGDSPDFVPIVFERNGKPHRRKSQSPPVNSKKRSPSVRSEPAEDLLPNDPVPEETPKEPVADPFGSNSIRSPSPKSLSVFSDRTIRSPPSSPKHHKRKRRIPSPPTEPLILVGRSEPIPPVRRHERHEPMTPVPMKVKSRTPTRITSTPMSSVGTGSSEDPRFLEPRRTPKRSRDMPLTPNSPSLPRGNVSMRNPRGRMGGVVRAGGGGGTTPIEWKPWAAGSSSSDRQQFLSYD
uniref:Mucin-5AC-like n=1 Tax=Haemonchus contortus TaxID=6289 RepID=A0A7I4Z4Q6_HAECO